MARRGVAGGGRFRGAPLTFGVSNFKSISSVEVHPTQLTLLAGANSSGKSSLLQALLFVAQSVASSDLVLNGDLVKLGEPLNVIRDDTDSVSFDFSFTTQEPSEAGDGPVEVRYRLRETFGIRAELFRPIAVQLFSDTNVLLEAEVAVDRPKSTQLPSVLDVERLLPITDPAQHGLTGAAYISFLGFLPHRLFFEVPHAQLWASFAEVFESPERSVFALDQFARSIEFRLGSAPDQGQAQQLGAKLREYRNQLVRGQQSPVDISFSESELRELFDVYVQAEAPDGFMREPLAEGRFGSRSILPGFASGPQDARGTALSWLGRFSEPLESFARTLRYLGPLREDPRVVYPLGHTVTTLPVGQKGEFTAGFLSQSHSAWVPYRNPRNEPRSAYLPTAVSEWATYLTIGEGVAVPPLGKLGFGFKIQLNGVERDLTDVGVGASQLLPVVVLVLGAPEGSTVLLEQPELHLHPAVQSRLADFFAVARPDLKLLIETHSEYIVTRLRRRIVEGELNLRNVEVLFAEQVEGETQFRSLGFNDLGDFEYWPEGFFDTIGSDTLAIAQAVRERMQESS